MQMHRNSDILASDILAFIYKPKLDRKTWTKAHSALFSLSRIYSNLSKHVALITSQTSDMCRHMADTDLRTSMRAIEDRILRLLAMVDLLISSKRNIIRSMVCDIGQIAKRNMNMILYRLLSCKLPKELCIRIICKV